MSGPWEKYQPQTAEAGPWVKYQQTTAPTTGAAVAQQAIQNLHANGLGNAAFLGQQQTPEQKRVLGLTLRAGAEGLASPATIVGNAANQAVNYGTQGINAVAGTNIPQLPMLSDTLDKGLTAIGTPEPQTIPEKIANVGGNMIASGPTFAGVGKLAEMAGVKGLEPLSQFTPSLGPSKAGAGAPSNATLKTTAQTAYKASEDAGAVLKPEAIQGVAAKVQSDLAQYGYLPKLQPQIGAVLDELNRVSQDPITMKGVDTLRKVVLNVAQSGNPSERMMAGKIIEHIDDMMLNVKPSDVVMGDASEASAQLVKAREAWKTFRKSELIDNLVVKGEDQALSTNSGGNVQNAIRQKLRGILDNPRTARLFNAEETDAIRQIVRGTPTQNALRIAGRLAPSSNGWLGVISTMAGGPAGAAVPLVGSLAKAGATHLTNRAVDNLSLLVRTGGKSPPKVGLLDGMDLNATAARLLTQGSSGLGLLSRPVFRSLLSGIPATATDNRNTGLLNQP